MSTQTSVNDSEKSFSLTPKIAVETTKINCPKCGHELDVDRILDRRSRNSPGFWVVHLTDENDKIIGIEIREVTARKQLEGLIFYRYEKGNEEMRKRSLASAQQGCDIEAKRCNIQNIIVREIDR